MLSRSRQEEFMRRALALARRAEGRTSPNPLVGAVVVRNGTIIAEGYHRRAGGPHGEIAALRKAGARARGAQLILNLEPCCHFGRTPPCTQAILDSGIREVYIGMKDPNPLVAGRGIRLLKRAGLRVVSGILETECQKLNEVFVKYIRTRKPFVILKSAMSLDGKIAAPGGESQWITGPEARGRVHALRDRVDAILVGAGTVLKDDPSLTTRLKRGVVKHPVRVILDNMGVVPPKARVFDNARTQKVLYVASRRVPESRLNRLRKRGVEVLILPEKRGGVSLPSLMTELGRRELTSVLIEGGGRVNGSALRDKIVDKIIWFMAPRIIGGDDAPGVVGGPGRRGLKHAVTVHDLRVTPVGADWMLEGYL